MEERDDITEFLKKMGMRDDQQPQANQWDSVIQPNSSYLIVGDVGTGKSALAYYLLETYSQKYNLLPTVVGLPRDKQVLLPSNFAILDDPSECTKHENTIAFIDEADLQLPIEDTKARQYVVNFLSLPRHRKQIFLLAFHFPRLVLGRYLPFFAAFLLKRPPYLIEFAGKRQNDALTQMMERAEERFAELPSEADVVKHTYVVAPRIRWQGMLQNPLCSFWAQELSEVWSGTQVEPPKPKLELLPTQDIVAPKMIRGWLADDPEMRAIYPISPEMVRKSVPVEEHPFDNSGYVIMEHKETRLRWVKQIY
jgi:hypothetical protein